MLNKTAAQGFTEEPSAKAQCKAMKQETTVVPKDELAEFPTAEQGTTTEPSANAQRDMLGY